MRIRGVQAAAVAAVAILALSACSDDPPEGGTITGNETTSAEATPESASPTASATPSPTKVVQTGKPGKVDPTTAGEVKAFVSQYLEAQNKATGNGDFSEVEKMIDKGCQICNNSKETISGIYEGGKKVKGGLFVNSKLGDVSPFQSYYVVSVLTDVSPATIVDKSGKTVGTVEGSKSKTYTYRVQKVSGSWRVMGGSSQS